LSGRESITNLLSGAGRDLQTPWTQRNKQPALSPIWKVWEVGNTGERVEKRETKGAGSPVNIQRVLHKHGDVRGRTGVALMSRWIEIGRGSCTYPSDYLFGQMTTPQIGHPMKRLEDHPT